MFHKKLSKSVSFFFSETPMKLEFTYFQVICFPSCFFSDFISLFTRKKNRKIQVFHPEPRTLQSKPQSQKAVKQSLVQHGKAVSLATRSIMITEYGSDFRTNEHYFSK